MNRSWVMLLEVENEEENIEENLKGSQGGGVVFCAGRIALASRAQHHFPLLDGQRQPRQSR